MKYKDDKGPRSKIYQALYCELSVAPDLLDSFSENKNIYKMINPHEYNESILELEEQLRKEFWRIIEENLTDKQQKIVRMLADGYTQMECAKVLNLNQSSIAKALIGNAARQNNNEVAIYGGIKRKLRKVVETDEKIKEILEKISELRDDTWVKE